MTNSPAFQTWNERYNTDEFIFGVEPNQYLKSVAGKYLKSGAHTLCVADGEGRNSVWLAQQGCRVDAFDLSPNAIRKAQQLANQNGVKVAYHVSDCESWNWGADTYDSIVAIFIQFYEPKMREQLFTKMIASLKPGGVLILQGYTPKQLEYKTGGPSQLENLYTENVVRDLLQSLKIKEIVLTEEVIAEGFAHNGMSALMGVVAIKS
jgi:2-polyprenyl-3-methyl-5-hydroxy-6-metoxy-1,4-benzoquinol methylase